MDKIKMVGESYNEMPYISKSFSSTLPYIQSSIGTLLGMEVPNLENARILEIGCSFGGNILSFAIANPKAELIGVDISKVQVDEGNKIIKKIGLNNIKLIHKNILEFENNLGKFDFIICHGVYSWVMESVKEGILNVIKNNLNENGLAVISYNTYPGWKTFDVIKDAMKFRIKSLENRGASIDVDNKLAFGKGAVEFLKNSVLFKDKGEILENIKEKDNHYLYHEYFEETNAPLYIYDFSKELEKYNLIHICDTDLLKSFPLNIDNEVEKAIDSECQDDYISKEQYYDFILNRQFRTSLITHSKNKNKLRITRDFELSNLRKLNLRSRVSFDINEGKYRMGDYFFPERFNKLLKKIDAAYPNTIKTIDLEKNEKDIKEVYKIVLELIFSKAVDFYTIELKNASNSLKLNKYYRKYIEYHLNTDEPLVAFSSFDGGITRASKLELEILLEFNGKNTKEDIVKEIIEKHKKGHINVNGDNIEKTLTEFVDRLANYIKNNFMNI